MDEFEVSQETKEYNRALCERFPFLIPSNRWSGKRITEAQDGGYWLGDPEAVPEPYDYEYTELDEMPDGWRKAFGEQMCEEIMEELVAHDLVDDYRITQIKEKYAQLRWYDYNSTDKIWREIIPKYENLSARTCINCGEPAVWISKGWISPYCDDCAEKMVERSSEYYTGEYTQYFSPINEYYSYEEEEDPE